MVALRKNTSRVYGYTLIEILVVATILGLLMGGGLAAYNRFHQKRRVEQAALVFANKLRLTQKMADSGEKIVGCRELQGYRVYAYDDETSATIDIACDNPPAYPISNPQQFSFNNEAKFYQGFNIMFRVLSQPVELNGDGEIEIVNMGSTVNYEYVVNVGEGGTITVEEV